MFFYGSKSSLLLQKPNLHCLGLNFWSFLEMQNSHKCKIVKCLQNANILLLMLLLVCMFIDTQVYMGPDLYV